MPSNRMLDVALQVTDDFNVSSGSDSAGVSEDEDVHLFTTINNTILSKPLAKSLSQNKKDELKTSKPNVKRYASLPNREQHQKFLTDFLSEVLNGAVFNATDRTNKVLNWVDPENLKQALDLELKNDPDSDEKLLQLAKAIIQHSVKTGHPYFMNQLFSSLDPYGFAGQILTDALNPSVYTFEVSPVFVLMEEVVLKEMRNIVGYPNGVGDGIFCPGGSMANGYAISCARYNFMPEVKTRGLHALPRLAIFTSEDAHYSIKKLASFMGIGSDNVYSIRTDTVGKMRVDHLEAEILRAKSDGALPFMVSATSGTTVIGAFDPLDQIADLCLKYKLWLHVDAAWGGGALMSKKYRKLLKGIERSDSVTWNPHKLLAAPQQCSTFLTRHEAVLSDCHSTNATYLFQKDKFYDTRYDIGDKHIQCGRRADVLKFWFMWRAKGTSGLEQHIDKLFENAEYFTNSIKSRTGFEMVVENPECTNVCFWYVPPSLRNLSRDSPEFSERLHKVAPKVKERMMREGSMMITYQPIHDKPNFFRLVLQNSSLDRSDMNYIIDKIEQLANDL
ncbi:cysteine sulfinic acid decarboxylase [Wyeomyia smithii]|uniref:cysteine sulfinic acid decarboxylase n=1 Tax=Wyeomyia smithii TaxID=174621 RepID=UPI002467C886|nr:cysteine sulfinic acid decarboxylase [Wyeomyia smithii]